MIGGWQATAVVERIEPVTGPRYRIAMVAELTSPYFVDFGFPIRIRSNEIHPMTSRGTVRLLWALAYNPRN